MELEFKEMGDGSLGAEFKATGNFNLHIETEGSGILTIEQRGTESGLYDLASRYLCKKVFDSDFEALVYPKWIRVTCKEVIKKGVVTFNGDEKTAS